VSQQERGERRGNALARELRAIADGLSHERRQLMASLDDIAHGRR
jgi:hypothetical protein